VPRNASSHSARLPIGTPAPSGTYRQPGRTCGHETHYHPKAETIVIKTRSLLLAVWAPEEPGEWIEHEVDGHDIVLKHLPGDRLTGFALSGKRRRDAAGY